MQTREAMKDFFDARAEQWDEIAVHDGHKIAAIAALAGIKKGDKVIDIACGTGIMFSPLLSYKPLQLLGIDLSPKMIKQAGEKHHDPRLTLMPLDLFDLEEAGFDVAVIYSAYPHFPNKKRLADKLHCILRPGGRFLVAHSQSMQAINHRHSDAHTATISTMLRPAMEEADVFHDCFSIDIIVDTPEFYVISGTRRA